MARKKDILLIGTVTGVFALLCLLVWVMPDTEYSMTERRELKKRPEWNLGTVMSGHFMSQFEDYNLDQFPFRDQFRSLKALTLLKADNNGVYVVDGVIGSLDYPLKEEKLSYASGRFQYVYDQYLKEKNCRVYLSVIPDKNYFYAEKNGYPSYDYSQLAKYMTEENAYMIYLDLFPVLEGEDYYRTDTHWKQESLPEVAEKLLNDMGVELSAEYKEVRTDTPFYGVYYGQAALPLAADEMNYLTNEMIEQFRVYDGQNGKNIPVYDEQKLKGKDPYEMFLGGPLSLVTIDNPACKNGRHLILFRDSFASSLAPLLAQGYEKTTLIDIRYLMPAMLGQLVDFADADVLFLYSSMVLNNSETIK